MRHEVRVFPNPDAVACAAASFVVASATAAVARRGEFIWAVSGGRTPWPMFEHLANADLAWDKFVIYQVDERVAPLDDRDRNLRYLMESVGDRGARIVPMAVEAADLDAACVDYADQLPDSFDLIHLGLGPDGHTASLMPEDDVLEIADRLVATTSREYQGRRRMTLTYRALARGRQLLWLVTGSEKRAVLARFLADDLSIPASRVMAASSIVMTDADAVEDTTRDDTYQAHSVG